MAAANRLRKQKKRAKLASSPHVAQAEDEDQQADKHTITARNAVRGSSSQPSRTVPAPSSNQEKFA